MDRWLLLVHLYSNSSLNGHFFCVVPVLTPVLLFDLWHLVKRVLCSLFLTNFIGLHSWETSRCMNVPKASIPNRFYARGCYFSLPGQSPFSRLIYPLPEDGGLGVHLTLDLNGRARFGPDVEWIDSIDYTVCGSLAWKQWWSMCVMIQSSNFSSHSSACSHHFHAGANNTI